VLARKNLIDLKKEFPRIRGTGKTYDSPSFGLIVSFGKNSVAQASFIVNKKVSRSSVDRHDVKRKLADAVSPFLSQLSKNTELVFLARQKAVESTRDEITAEVKEVLRRARLVPS
jgi:ribonuclease P protein component